MSFVFNGLAIYVDGAGRGHTGGVGYTYMYSYTHGVKPNVNLIYNTRHTNMLV